MAVEYGEPLEIHELDSARAAVRSGEGAEVGSGMADVVRLLLAQQEGERRRREERDRIQQEQQERWEETQRAEERRRQAAHELQIETLPSLLSGRSGGPRSGAGGLGEHVKLTKLTETDDVEAFLTTFERVMTIGRVPEETWTLRLAPQLSGKALQAYAAVPTTDAAVYKKVKKAILRRYDISEESYRQRFRNERKKGGEAYGDLAVRLQDLARKWLVGCGSVEEVVEKLVVEQLMATMPGELRVWVAERKPGKGEEAGRLADDYVQARRPLYAKPDSKRQEGEKKTSSVGGPETRKCHKCGAEGHLRRNCPVKDETTEGTTSAGSAGKRPVKCYNCGNVGHISMNCPSKASYFCKDGWGRSVARVGQVEGTAVSDILLDTGCTRTMVRRDLVPEECLLPGEAVTILCAHGDMALYPLAKVRIEVEGVGMEVKAAVSESLPVAALLRTDTPQLGKLLHTNPLAVHTKGMDHALVTTRAQAQQKAVEEDQQQQKQDDSGVKPRPLEHQEQTGADADLGCGGPGLVEGKGKGGGITDPRGEGAGGEVQVIQGGGGNGRTVGGEFADDMFTIPREREKKTRRSKREERRAYGLVRAKDGPRKQQGEEGLDLTLEQLRQLQETDNTLVGAVEGDWFSRKNGVLYRQWVERGQPEEAAVELIVLPKQCRKTVLQLAHSIPLGGHLGKKKTADRILRRFYWPSLFRDVADFCRSCSACQKSGRRKVSVSPMVPLPIISEPFRRMAMDIVGPLPRSRSGNRFVLVLCDYATRYPEAVPMRTVDAEAVADELVKVFSRVGIPEEILTDQGTNFTSKLLGELYRLQNIKALRTSPYHPQTDGLVERFNGTLKDMLRKTAQEDGKDWDKLLPYLLFAYREVPQSSTGFSPFELLYGWDVRGPLDVVKEQWETNPIGEESVVSHVLLMRERLEQMCTLVQGNLQEAQGRQKTWFDRKARERTLLPGDRVLVLLPTSTSKLLAQWYGPYQVLRRVGKVNYEVEMGDRRKKKRILHINLLREWHKPAESGYFVSEVEEGEEEIESSTWDGGERGELVVGEQLNEGQTRELEELLHRYRDTLMEVPGCTSITEHRIETGESTPIRLPPYRLPHAYREAVQRELEEMKAHKIIEPANSDWAAPMVLVKKKDGTLRLCVDYRRLNTTTRADAYPMPRIEDMIDQLGKAKYLTTLDLTKGYWQVPVAKRDRPKTAFTTPFGLFQFLRMPFGLKGAPATFQRMIDHLLQGLGEFTGAYLDDVVVFSVTWEEHMQHVEAVLTRLREAGLTAKPRKCQFGMAQCVYLGHVVGGGRVWVEESKVGAIQRMPRPHTKRDVRAFLGLSGYYRKFIPGYASIATALSDLTRKAQPEQVIWTADCEEAFGRLKTLLCSAPVLRAPDLENSYVLQTDASNRGVGAVLSQRDADGCDQPVAYFSKKLLPREERYSTIEKECLAIKLAIQAFRVYLLGRHFTVQTDHRALTWLDRVKENNGRLTRWSLALQPFQFTVEHRPGTQNGNADGLSRLPPEDPT